jgi:chemotaxis protein MotA
MTMTSFLGSCLGILSVLFAQVYLGGSFEQLFQLPAFVILCLGLIGSLISAFRMPDILRAFSIGFFENSSREFTSAQLAEVLLKISNQARKEGLLSLENLKSEITHPDLLLGIRFLMDGVETEVLKELYQRELETLSEAQQVSLDVFDLIASQAPVFGILASVVGLIPVLSNLSDPARIGVGISASLVATLYGLLIGTVFTPVAQRLRGTFELEQVEKKMINVGISGIAQGITPIFLKEKLLRFDRNFNGLIAP